jgi:hypothetical protein
VATINNGNVFYVSFTYKDKGGAEWGVVEFNPDNDGNLGETDYSKALSGWIRMADLTVVYDYISFAEDHASEFKPYTGTYGEFKTGGKVVFWTYPGAGFIAWEEDAFEMNDFFEFSDTYTDAANRLWALSLLLWCQECLGVRQRPSGTGIEKAQPTPIDSQTPPSQSAEDSILPNAGTVPGEDKKDSAVCDYCHCRRCRHRHSCLIAVF